MNENLMIVGVGGQGTLLAARLVGEAAMLAGFDVKVSEVHGMAQRGGSVVSCVKYGKDIYSPIIAKGEADTLISFELLEALRWSDYLKKDGRIIVNLQKILPMSVAAGRSSYPENIRDMITASASVSMFINALDVASECGNIKVVNSVLLGAYAASQATIAKRFWLDTMKRILPLRVQQVNAEAFEKGFNIK